MAKTAMKTASLALANAWTCGMMLNAAKARCGHGQFGTWLNRHMVPADICARTCQRYMKLARQHADLRSLQESPVSLHQVCVACAMAPGSEPVPAKRSKPARAPAHHSGEELLPSQALMTTVNALIANISRLAASGQALGDDDLGQLLLAKDLLDKLCDNFRAKQEYVAPTSSAQSSPAHGGTASSATPGKYDTLVVFGAATSAPDAAATASPAAPLSGMTNPRWEGMP